MFICGQEYKLNTINITWINIRYVLIMYDVESIWRRKTQTNRLIHSYKELSELRSDIRLLYHKFELRSTRYSGIIQTGNSKKKFYFHSFIRFRKCH